MRGLTPRPCAAYFAQTPRVSAAQARESRVVSGSLAPPRARRVRLAEIRFGLGSQRGRFLARPFPWSDQSRRASLGLCDANQDREAQERVFFPRCSVS